MAPAVVPIANTFSNYLNWQIALTATYGTVFQYGNVADTICKLIKFTFWDISSVMLFHLIFKSIDVASGGSFDWTYDTEGVLYSYALELRDTGLYG